MAFPRSLLNEGEELVLDLRPHWSFFAGPAATLALAIAVLAAMAVSDAPDWALIAVSAAGVAALVWFLGRWSRWTTTNFVLTSDRLIYRSGVVAKKGIEIPLERVNTVFFDQTVFERLLRFGDLRIESGGERGTQSFANIPKPSAVQNEIYRQIEDNQERMSGGGRRRERTELSPIEQLERLDELRQRGVLTQDEFEAKKAQLLERM